MSNLPNKRLNPRDRGVIEAFGLKVIECPVEKAELDRLHTLAKPEVLAVVHAKYPPADMAILAKYGQATKDFCINYGGNYDTESRFNFAGDDPDAPLVPGTGGGCRLRMYEWSKSQRALLDKHTLARQKWELALREKRRVYAALIAGSATFNDLVAIWPAAETLRARIMPVSSEQRALAALSAEAIAIIKADNAGAAA